MQIKISFKTKKGRRVIRAPGWEKSIIKHPKTYSQQK